MSTKPVGDDLALINAPTTLDVQNNTAVTEKQIGVINDGAKTQHRSELQSLSLDILDITEKMKNMKIDDTIDRRVNVTVNIIQDQIKPAEKDTDNRDSNQTIQTNPIKAIHHIQSPSAVSTSPVCAKRKTGKTSKRKKRKAFDTDIALDPTNISMESKQGEEKRQKTTEKPRKKSIFQRIKQKLFRRKTKAPKAAQTEKLLPCQTPPKATNEARISDGTNHTTEHFTEDRCNKKSSGTVLVRYSVEQINQEYDKTTKPDRPESLIQLLEDSKLSDKEQSTPDQKDRTEETQKMVIDDIVVEQFNTTTSVVDRTIIENIDLPLIHQTGLAITEMTVVDAGAPEYDESGLNIIADTEIAYEFKKSTEDDIISRCNIVNQSFQILCNEAESTKSVEAGELALEADRRKFKKQTNSDLKLADIIEYLPKDETRRDQIIAEEGVQTKHSDEMKANQLVYFQSSMPKDLVNWTIDISKMTHDEFVQTVYNLREKIGHEKNPEEYPEYEFLTEFEMTKRLETIQRQIRDDGRQAFEELVRLAAEQKKVEKAKKERFKNVSTVNEEQISNLEKAKDSVDKKIYYTANEVIKIARKMHYGGYKGKRYFQYLEIKEKKDREEHQAKLKDLFENLFDDEIEDDFDDLSDETGDTDTYSTETPLPKIRENYKTDQERLNDIHKKFFKDDDNNGEYYDDDDVEEDDGRVGIGGGGDTNDDHVTDKNLFDGGGTEPDEQKSEKQQGEERKSIAEILLKYWNYDEKRERIIEKDWVSWKDRAGFTVEPKIKKDTVQKMGKIEKKLMMKKPRKTYYLGKERLNRSQNAAENTIACTKTDDGCDGNLKGLPEGPAEKMQGDWEILKALLLTADATSVETVSYPTEHDDVPLWQRKRRRHIPRLY